MHSQIDLYVILFRVSISALSLFFLYKLFKQHALPLLKARASTEIEERTLLEQSYQELIQQKLMAEKQLSTQQHQFNQLMEAITQWRERVVQRQKEKDEERARNTEKYQQKHASQLKNLSEKKMRTLVVEEAIERTLEAASASYSSEKSFNALLKHLGEGK